MELALDQVCMNVVPDQRSRILGARLMTDHSRDEIERLAHLGKHCRDGPPQIMRVELVDWQLVPTCQEEVSDTGRRQNSPYLRFEKRSFLYMLEPVGKNLLG